MERALTDRAFWEERQIPQANLPLGGYRPPWLEQVRAFLPDTPQASCLEVGTVPGAMLLFFASQLGYACTGIDISARLADVEVAFGRQGISARFLQVDFREWDPEEDFAVVYSCGFVEHFEDYAEIIARHWRLVRPGGVLILTVPTLTPYQAAIRRILYTRDKWNEVLRTHVTGIMNSGTLRRCVASLEGSRVEYGDYIRCADCWITRETPGVRRWASLLLPGIKFLERVAAGIGKSSRWYSPEALVVARKVAT